MNSDNGDYILLPPLQCIYRHVGTDQYPELRQRRSHRIRRDSVNERQIRSGMPYVKTIV